MYYLGYVPLYILSLLPWFVMYRISDFLTFLVYNVFGYRKSVVLANLAIAFPEKTQEERNKIAKDFYLLLMDTIVETIKLISMSKEGVMKKFTGDASIINEVMARGRNVTILAMHNFNWELTNLNIVIQLKYPFIGIYMPLTNKFFERLLADMRTRYGTIIIPAPKFTTEFVKYANMHHIIALVADQNPGNPDNATWVPFFGKLTPFVKGPEKGARLNSNAVLFAHFYPVRRGHYSFDCKIATYNAAELPEEELTRMYVAYVEECVRKHPANYLWSHRRWKYSK
jgi:Kdo2-lipid IVA lauroyltransferase/acyltransferase